MKFTEKSKTQPGMAFSCRELVTRSLNGTMPAIYHEGSFDCPDGAGVTFLKQEEISGDVFPPQNPQLEDVSMMNDDFNKLKTDFAKSVAEVQKKSTKHSTRRNEPAHSSQSA